MGKGVSPWCNSINGPIGRKMRGAHTEDKETRIWAISRGGHHKIDGGKFVREYRCHLKWKTNFQIDQITKKRGERETE